MNKLTARDWFTVLIVSLCYLGLFIIIDKYIGDKVIKDALNGLLATISIPIIIGVFVNRFFFEEVMIHASNAHKVSIEILKQGLLGVTDSWSEFDFKKMIKESSSIKVMSIYSSTWINANFDELSEFSNTKGKSLTFIFLDPESSSVPALEHKFKQAGTEAVDLKRKINESISKAKGLKRENSRHGKLKVLVQPFMPAYSYYEFDDQVIYIPYLQSPGRSNKLPAFMFNKSESECLGRVLSDDVTKAQNEFSVDVTVENKDGET